MNTAEEAFQDFRAKLIAGKNRQHNVEKEALRKKCAEQMALLIKEQQMEIMEIRDSEPTALVAKYVSSSSNAASTTARKQEDTAEEVIDSDEEDEKPESPAAHHEVTAAAMEISKKRSRASDASSEPMIKHRRQSIISINTDDGTAASYFAPASPPASIASVASTRPQRARKPPPPRGEINYSKPDKVTPAAHPTPPPPPPAAKEDSPKPTSLDLQFCHHILTLISEARAARFFLQPVDAKMYPSYHTVISRPMDLSTMGHKLETGVYRTGDEFKADFDLMIKNCLRFNPSGEVARDMGIMLERHFSNEWNWRQKWEKEYRRKSGGSASGRK